MFIKREEMKNTGDDIFSVCPSVKYSNHQTNHTMNTSILIPALLSIDSVSGKQYQDILRHGAPLV